MKKVLLRKDSNCLVCDLITLILGLGLVIICYNLLFDYRSYSRNFQLMKEDIKRMIKK